MAANKRAKGRRIYNQEKGGEKKKKESQEGASRVSDSLGSSGQSALSWPLQGKEETRGKREREHRGVPLDSLSGAGVGL